MNHRIVLLLGTGLLGGFAALVACSAPDPGSVTYAERTSAAGGDTTGGGASSSSSSSSGGDAGSTGTKADAVFGTSTFAYTDPGVTANTAAGAHNGTVVGKDCSQSACHGAGGGGPTWTFAGTLYGAGGTATIAKGEVRVVTADGGLVGSAYTDADGNFWYQGGALPAGSKVGVRADGVTTVQHMATPLAATNTGCSSASSNCHGTAGQGPVHVP